MLDPQIDIWAVAHPVLKRILRERYSPRRTLREVRKRLPEWFHAAPQFPELVRDALREVAKGERRAVSDPVELAQQRDEAQRTRRALSLGLLGASLLIGSAVLWTQASEHGIWHATVIGVAGLVAFAAGWPRR